jgi:hypothetical protein
MNEPSFDSWTELKEKGHIRKVCLKSATARRATVSEGDCFEA